MAHKAFENVNRYFDQAAKVLDLDAKEALLLKTPARELKVECNVPMDDGGVMVGKEIEIELNIEADLAE